VHVSLMRAFPDLMQSVVEKHALFDIAVSFLRHTCAKLHYQ